MTDRSSIITDEHSRGPALGADDDFDAVSAFLSNLVGEDEPKRRSILTDAEAGATPEETAGGDATLD